MSQDELIKRRLGAETTGWRGAVLSVGSLLWDDGNENRRKVWRRERLVSEGRLPVTTPIRYGRRASSRGGTYGICFDPAIGEGQGSLIPLRFPIRDFGDLVTEAEALWCAEDHTTDAGGIAAAWGTVGVLFSGGCWGELAPAWADYFRRYGKLIPPVDVAGVLNIPWPVSLTNRLAADADVILAVATAGQDRWPSVAEIATAWVGQNNGYEWYFIENRRHGVRTCQDERIWEELKRAQPAWMDEPAHRRAFLTTGLTPAPM